MPTPLNSEAETASLIPKRLLGLPAMRALLAQLGAAAASIAYLQWSAAHGSSALQPDLVHGIIAACLGLLLRLPLWWVPINALFVPAALWVQGLAISPTWFLGAFIALVMVFWTTYRTQVPLFLSSRDVCTRMASMLQSGSQLRLMDLGCGFGGVLRAIHRVSPGLRLAGRELAPLPAWIAQLRLCSIPQADIQRTDFWQEDLSKYDLVYAFLSPEPMSRLWQKVCAEMRPGSLFVSHAFAVPDVSPDLTLPLPGGRRPPLFVWRL